jgi:hypothetical protein
MITTEKDGDNIDNILSETIFFPIYAQGDVPPRSFPTWFVEKRKVPQRSDIGLYSECTTFEVRLFQIYKSLLRTYNL